MSVKSSSQPVPNSDALKRMNFLLQASALSFADEKHNVSRFFNFTLKNIAKRNVLRIDPEVKKLICKRCHTLLVPAVSSTIRLQMGRQPHRTTTCTACDKLRRQPFDAPKSKRSNKRRKKKLHKQRDKDKQPKHASVDNAASVAPSEASRSSATLDAVASQQYSAAPATL
eukprot:TRINITY_DN5295_c0_g1_i1.p1 TRINITY_DN5295_c0_g1~~TRINITY_DN5295_c0_g1_i1.p1  ORF type:complete len:170 (-),score=19.06 TRINITY_DN5295_c0_g1_i1:30-539(-)